MTNVHLIIGASGQVGEHLMQAINAAGLQAVGSCQAHPVEELHPLDIRSKEEVDGLVTRFHPGVVYLPASLTNVDYVESHPDEGYAINVTGVQHAVQAANLSGSKLVYFSSDYVFDGKTGNYREEDTPNPICVYGLQKLIAEAYIALHAHDFLVLRTTGVYGWERQGKNFINRLIHMLKAGQALNVPVDQIGTPTYAPDLARAAVELALSGRQGVYHVAGSEAVDRYAFAVHAAEVFGLNSSLIHGIPTSSLGQTAPRPLRGGLNIAKASSQLSFELRSYRAGLQNMYQTAGSI